jgi:hypothetical protein
VLAADIAGIAELVASLHDLVVRIESIHRKTGLLRMLRVGPVVAAAVAPPSQPAIIEERFSCVMDSASFRQRRVAISGMHQCLSSGHPDENVSRIRNIVAVMAAAVQSILIEKRVQMKDLIAIHLNGSSRIQIWV